MARVAWSIYKRHVLQDLVSVQSHKLQLQARITKENCVSVFTVERSNRFKIRQPPLRFVQACPKKGAEQSITTPSYASCYCRAAPVPSAWWPVMQAASAQGWDACPCLPFPKIPRGPEQSETLVLCVPLAPCCLLPARRVHQMLLLSVVTNALINLTTLLLNHSNILFKTIIWKIAWQRTWWLFLLRNGARFTEGLQASLR